MASRRFPYDGTSAPIGSGGGGSGMRMTLEPWLATPPEPPPPGPTNMAIAITKAPSCSNQSTGQWTVQTLATWDPVPVGVTAMDTEIWNNGVRTGNGAGIPASTQSIGTYSGNAASVDHYIRARYRYSGGKVSDWSASPVLSIDNPCS